jgi:hypothetical protein
MVLDVVLPSAPDFSWDHATTGELDSDGHVLVIVTVRARCFHNTILDVSS